MARLVLVAVLVATAGCDDTSGSTPDGFVSVGTGDTYGEWELFAEYEDGEWTGCLRIDHYDTVQRCGDPDAGLVTFESGEGAKFGAVPEGGALDFDDGGRVPLLEGRFFVVASEARVRLSG